MMRTSGFVASADGPWACYRCCVFGDTAAGWWAHGEKKHRPKLVLSSLDEMRPLMMRALLDLDKRKGENITTWAATLANDVAMAGDEHAPPLPR